MQRRLQQCRGAGAVVVDPRPLDNAVEVSAGHHHVVLVLARQLRDHVVVGAGLRRHHLDECRGTLRSQGHTVGEASADDRDAVRDRSRGTWDRRIDARRVRDDQA